MTNREAAIQFLRNHDLEHDDKVDELTEIINKQMSSESNLQVLEELKLLEKGLELALAREKSPSFYMELKALIQTHGVIETQVLCLIHRLKEVEAEKQFEETNASWQRLMAPELGGSD